MKTIRLVLGTFLLTLFEASATTVYVSSTSTNPTAPYTSWATAATNIQDAVDVAANGDTVLVTNGLYGFGGRPVGTALLTNRVAIEKPMILASVNGPALTTIRGYQLSGTVMGDGAVRCVYLASGAVLSGFTLIGGATRDFSGDVTTEQNGGGAWCESATSLVTNCILWGNAAFSGGGGVYSGTLNSCKLMANSAGQGGGALNATLNNCIIATNRVGSAGGGALFCTLNNCTVVLNSAMSGQGGGIIGSAATNCILYYNGAPDGPNYFDQCLGCASPSFCCTTPLPYSGVPFGGVGNITNEPVFVNLPGFDFHLQPASPCINAGSNAFAVDSTDLDGNPRISGGVVDMGAYEFQFSGPPVIAVQPADQKAIPGSNVTFTVIARGALPLSYQWQFNGTAIPNATDSSLVLQAVTTSQEGLYSVVVSNALGKVPSAQASLTLWPDGAAYVWQDSPIPTPPYVSWATAGHSIQDAVDEAVPGLVVLVTNGTYGVGGRVATVVTGLALTNRVVVDKPITVRSINGPQFTLIQGFQVPGSINGPAAVRCFYLTDGAIISGFTVTNGATSPIGLFDDRIAGAAWCQSTNATITNCILAGNAGSAQAGAVSRGTLIDCVLVGNVARGDDGSGGSYAGGALMSTLIRCTLSGNSAEGGLGWGGAAEGSTLIQCTVENNSASYAGGGVYSCGLFNCALSANSAQYGGAASSSQFTNCTLTGNSAIGGGGVVNSSLLNCILYYNTSIDANANYDSISTFRYTCTYPLPASGPGNTAADPQLANASHLGELSPCRGAGLAGTTVGTDIDGEPWANPPSIGCDEYYAGGITGPLNVAIGAANTNVVPGSPLSLTALIQGRASASVWDFGDGVIVSNRPYASHAWAVAGDYLVTLRAFNDSQPAGIAATLTIHVSSKLLHYISAASTNPVSPFTSWATAATNIQSAIDAAASEDLLLVTNGLYAGGVTVSKPLTLLSVNGARSTIIDGAGKTQCIYLTDGVSLSGFTLTNGFAATGGGLGCSSIGAYITNCVIVGNVATNGGGASGGTLYNCVITRNSVSAAQFGLAGGAYGSVLYNCTVSDNQAFQYGGVYSRDAVYNSIIYSNTAQVYPNFWDGMWLYYCCASPLPTNGVGNITNAPLFVNEVNSDFHLQSGSLCVDAGNNAFVTNTTDLDGHPRISGGSVDMGAYEFQSSGPPVITLQPVSQAVAVGADVTFTVGASGSTPLFWQWLLNGVPIVAQTNSSLTLKSVTMQQAGAYSVIVSNSLGKATSTPANLTVRLTGASYVWQNSPNPTPPYDSWPTAATNIQDAINASLPGGLVLVTNGLYPGGVSLDRLVTVQSFNGPKVTLIDGGGANRCVTMTNGASLSGFTLTNGRAQQGGGVWCSSTNAYVTNCIIVGNVAAAGGGTFAGTLYNCQLSGNSATSGGGGGSYASMLYNCTVSGNSATTGGGVFSGGFYNSIIYFNNAPFGPNFANIFYMLNCCTTPDPVFGSGNINSDPLFIDLAAGNLHLQSDSPCINGGDNSFVHGTTDLDGNPRIFDATVDMGAYEFQSPIGPLIVQQPASQSVIAGDIVVFAASARGTLPLSWQWQFNGVAIPHATNSILTLGPLVTNQAGGYSVVITNFVGSVTSQVAMLTVQGAPPVITQQPVSQTAYVGSDVSFTVGVASVLPLWWQWQFNGAPLVATGSVLTVPAVTLKQAGAYSVIVTNFLGSVTSQVATLIVLDAAPTISLQPLNQTTYAGGTVTFTAGATGSQPFSWQWRFNGTAIPGATGSSFTLAGITPDQAGAYSVVVTNLLGSATSADAILTVTLPLASYVWQDSPSPTPPYTNWATAAHVIQDAVDAASAGYVIIVTNGIYATGGRTVGAGLLTNRLVLDKPLTVRSVNGPDVTVIQGYQVPGTTNGDAAVRCVYVRTNIVLSGFTLSNGATLQIPASGNSTPTDMSGGGVFSELWNNAVLMNCKLLGNSAADSGGGAYLCPLYNCLVAGNSAGNTGGGTCFCAVTNSTIVHNSGFYGGGATVGILFNSIIYYNTHTSVFGDDNWVADKGGMIVHCCTTPAFSLPEWQNIDAAPLFVDEPNGDFHLQPGSPCINSGDNTYVTSATDLDGNPRIFGGTVDIGAYEYQGSVIPLAWLQQYGLPTDGSADFIDTDGDGLNNWQEWVAGTNPTNALSNLRLLSVISDGSSGVTVTWQSVAGVNYFLERTTAMLLPFTSDDTNRVTVKTNIVGQAGTTSYDDPTPTDSGPFFYRVGVAFR